MGRHTKGGWCLDCLQNPDPGADPLAGGVVVQTLEGISVDYFINITDIVTLWRYLCGYRYIMADTGGC